ncbi:MAG: polyhydroxyalkanoic acid system family protein [Rhodoferax sp.]|nr:polyhydroxyalkanoic acid system family protein [Rhodoferax sp.]
MADLHIVRAHTLGFAKARKIAFDWAEQVEREFGMECTYEEGRSADLVRFTRSGVQGELHVTKDKFELDARLGFLLGAFKGRIEAEVVKLLDTMLPHEAAAKPVARKAAPRK